MSQKNIPTEIILDFNEEISDFFSRTNRLSGLDITIEDLFRELITYISFPEYLEQGIAALISDLILYLDRKEYDCNKRISEQIRQLAIAVYNRLDNLGLYTNIYGKNYEFPYELKNYINSSTIIFTKKEDLHD